MHNKLPHFVLLASNVYLILLFQIWRPVTCSVIIISPNKVFGDIMVLASPPRPPPPVDPDDVNTLTQNIQPISFKFYIWVDTPWGTLLLKFDTLRGLEQLRSQPNDTRIPQIFKMQYLHN